MSVAYGHAGDLEVIIVIRKTTVWTLLLMLTVVWICPVFADTLQDAQNKQQNVESQIGNITTQKNQTESQVNALEDEMNYYESIEARQEQRYELLLREAGDIEKYLSGLQADIEEAEIQYEESYAVFVKRMRAMQEITSVSYLDALFKATSILDFFERLELIVTIAKSDKKMIEELKVLKSDLEIKKALQQDAISFFEDSAQSQLVRIEELQNSRSDVEDKLRQKENELKALEKKLDDLNRESDRLIHEIKKLQSTRKYTGGTMEWPVPSAHNVGSSFGMRPHPILKVNKMHTGIDIGAAHGASIVASNNGTVTLAAYLSGYGYTVILDHGGGISTLYAHCSSLLVKTGQSVTKGQTIARIGSTGLSTGPHLHFEVRENGVPVDPLINYLKKAN